MKEWKKRLIVFLCTILVAPTVLQALPIRPMSQVQAAGNVGVYCDFSREYNPSTQKSEIAAVTVEVGEMVELGCYFRFCNAKTQKSGYLFDLKKGVNYSSSNSKVIAVNKTKGTMTPKKVGKATVKVKYAGYTETIPVNVVKKGSLKLSSYKKYQRIAQNIVNLDPKHINSRNQYDVLKKLYTYTNEVGINKCPIDNWGRKMQKKTIKFNGSVEEFREPTNTVLVPLMAEARIRYEDVFEYFTQKCPTGTRPSKHFKVKKISTPKVNGRAFDIYLKNKVNSDQICAIKAHYKEFNTEKKDGKAIVPFHITDCRDNSSIYAICTVKEKSNKITIAINTKSQYNSRTKFAKGKYRLGDNVKGSWLSGTVIRVK